MLNQFIFSLTFILLYSSKQHSANNISKFNRTPKSNIEYECRSCPGSDLIDNNIIKLSWFGEDKKELILTMVWTETKMIIKKDYTVQHTGEKSNLPSSITLIKTTKHVKQNIIFCGCIVYAPFIKIKITMLAF